ncbi:FAD/NAD(P)-binding domain-containing protein [Dothidotthia symphoricarpi CBS 119687]|uniref:FAD/NAD(P)-binding domain-containing protein n=1 Tax=Dothidotthia symphoricarpi CBS 119687 TaxID=1392245 RepID=A0A6A6AIY2_9PLEO|nr:FAD/NAD(P)-binding domain-containing protein [Dothidotthia symphoricarpi CBS 119687]KAF2131055.1 FAD/NAD(P)-binding domain-containing protein [Dothidotthia symphoricarpi CBS 119687]
MSTETILILGGSYAGISAAHYALKHTIPSLPKKDGVTYNVTMVNPSKDFYWRFAAPRACASSHMMPSSKIFYPIEPAFTYAFPKFKFVQGTATHVDPAGQTVSVTTADGAQTSIPYAALVVATGFTTPSPLFTQTTDAAALESTYKAFQTSLTSATSVVIGGGGPVGVETAGEIAELLNGKPGFMSAALKKPKVKVTLVCADKKILPVLREAIGQTAETYLKRLGCNVVYNTKVVTSTKFGEGEQSKTRVELSNGETMEADIYIDATGSRPNTGFLPKEWLDNRNRIACNNKTLRVDHESAGPRVYVVGDVGSYTRGGVMDLTDAVPVAMTNLKTDLVAHLSGSAPAGDRHYVENTKESQVVPIGTQKGVGAFNGYRLPSQMVWMMKGRDYLIGMALEPTLKGDNFKKEGKWIAQPGSAGQRIALSSG